MDSLIAIGSLAAVIYGVIAIFRIQYGLGHQNMDVVIMQMDEAIEEFLMKYKSLSEQELIEHRYERFRNM